MKNSILTILFLFSTLSGIAQNSGTRISPERLTRLEAFVKQELQAGNIPGAVVQITHQNKVVYQGAWGVSNVSDKRPLLQDDIFYIQSMTKPVISVALMMLYEEGRFQLNDPVSKYLPAFKNIQVDKNLEDGMGGEKTSPIHEMTIAELLSHTAGLTHGLGPGKFDQEFMKEYFGKPYIDIRARVDEISKLPLMGQPGAQWAYSAAPDILSVLIEQFSGMSTNDFLTERIFKPLEMKDTGYNLTKSQQARFVQVHGKSSGTLVSLKQQPKTEGNTVWSGVNALFSTAADYSNFCLMLANGGVWKGKQLLSPNTIKLMTSNHTGSMFNKQGEGFGLGFAVVQDVAATRNLGTVGLFYWGGAFNTHFFVDPTEQVVAVFMTHTDTFDWYYHNKLRQLVYQAFIK